MRRFLFLGGFILLPFLCFAQTGFELSVTDSTGKAIPGLAILVSNPSLGVEITGLSDINGKYRKVGLSTAGKYNIRVFGGNFYKDGLVSNLTLVSGKTTSLVIQMSEKVAQLAAVIVQADTYKSINLVNAEVASELNSKEIELLPLEGRDITRVLYRLPNITQATGFYPEAPNVSINGANSLYTNYQIDGLDNNENFLGGQRFAMPVGFTETITALTNNFSAQYGLTSNGVINVTSKSGTNETHGEGFYVVRPGPVIDASSPFAQRDLSGNQVKDGFQRHQLGAAIGGAIIEDRTFYFLNLEHTIDLKDNLLNSPDLNVNETVRGTNRFTYLSAKLDHHWNDNIRSSIRINTGNVDIERQGGGLEGGVTFPSAGNFQQRNSLNVAWKNDYQIGKFTAESNYQYGSFNWNYAEPVNPEEPNVSVLNPSEQTIAVLGHPGFVFDERERSHVLQQKFTLIDRGHVLKFGAQLRSSKFDLFGGGNPNGSYTVKLTDEELLALQNENLGSSITPEDIPSTVEVLNYGVELRPNSFEKRQNIFSIYLEDEYTLLPGLNASFGLRYDYDNLSKGANGKGDLNNLAPRVSLNYTLSPNASVRAGYGVYYDKILYAIYSDARQFSTNSADFQAQVQELSRLGLLPENINLGDLVNEGNLVANIGEVDYLDGPSSEELQGERNSAFSNELRILQPGGYDNPYSHQFMIGYQRKISENTLFYVDAMHNRSYNLFRLRDLNAPSAYPIDPEFVQVRSQEEADLTRPVPILQDDQGAYAIIDGEVRRGIARNVVVTESEGRSNYYALNVTLQNELGKDRFGYRVMYTLSYLENNTEDINFRAMDANDFTAEWGPSINDRRHLINVIFNYQPIPRFSVNLAGLFQSGQPINRIPDATIYGTTDLNGDGRSFGDAYVGNSDRSPGESRNSDRLPWAETIDLSAFYSMDVGSAQLEFGGYVFNLFNSVNLSGYSNNATQSNQIQVGPAGSGTVRRNAGPPRQFQFSVRYLF